MREGSVSKVQECKQQAECGKACETATSLVFSAKCQTERIRKGDDGGGGADKTERNLI